MTNLIHIIGQQGVGKTTLALDIIAGLERRGKSGLSLVESGLQVDQQFVISDLRGQYRSPYKHVVRTYDYVIVEHQEPPAITDAKSGDLIIHLVRLP
jgi:GTPase SAR1 family protein